MNRRCCTGVETTFTARVAASDLRRDHDKGAPKTTRLLRDAITATRNRHRAEMELSPLMGCSSMGS